ncbi:hypothetical protein A0256_17120 [Mucilaginibacter sp. PAMC 26640]|nr:hypothetical protein A0256_17120 [Mucilaginibacter sp. PAMC 26640]
MNNIKLARWFWNWSNDVQFSNFRNAACNEDQFPDYLCFIKIFSIFIKPFKGYSVYVKLGGLKKLRMQITIYG